MEKRFADTPDVITKSRLLQTRLHAGQGDLTAAQACLDTVSGELEDVDALSADTSLEYARTLFRISRDAEAKSLLGKLAQRFENDSEIIQQIENLLDEPVGFRQRMQARDLNKDGIKAFEAGNLDGAATAFREALAIVPSHTALNLNLVQVLMKQYSGDRSRKALLTDCQNHLSKLSELPKQHRQYPRYQALNKKLEALRS